MSPCGWRVHAYASAYFRARFRAWHIYVLTHGQGEFTCLLVLCCCVRYAHERLQGVDAGGARAESRGLDQRSVELDERTVVPGEVDPNCCAFRVLTPRWWWAQQMAQS